MSRVAGVVAGVAVVGLLGLAIAVAAVVSWLV